MDRLNQALKEKLKAGILNELMKGPKRYSDILDNLPIDDSGQMNYHLKQLIGLGLVKKTNKKYSLTQRGEQLSIYIRQFRFKEIYPLTVVCVALTNKKTILLSKRSRKPYLGLWLFPGGKVKIGETIKDSSERAMKKELNAEIEFKKSFGIYPTIVREEGNIKYHAYLIGVRASLVDESCLDRLETYYSMKKNLGVCDSRFFTYEEIENLEIVPSNEKMIKDVFKEEFVFSEQEINSYS